MVKRSENGVITNPFWLAPGHTLGEADALMAKYHISGVPICDKGKLIGIITNRDLKFETDMDRLIDDVMTKENLVTATEGTTLEEAKEILRHRKVEKLPIVDERDAPEGPHHHQGHREGRGCTPTAARDEGGRLLCGAAIGVTADVLDRVAALVEARRRRAAVWTPPTAMPRASSEAVSRIKALYPDVQLIAGNVATAEGNRSPYRGRRRLREGRHRPRLHLHHPCGGRYRRAPDHRRISTPPAMAAKYGIPVIADGGIKYSGDIAKAIWPPAATWSCWALCWLAVRKAPGDMEIYQGRQFKVYRGMGSLAAMNKRLQGPLLPDRARRSWCPKGSKAVCLTREPCPRRCSSSWAVSAPVWATAAAPPFPDLQERSQFVRITSAGLRESHPHDIYITKEAPNYTIAGNK